jgi:homoserine kinase type II
MYAETLLTDVCRAFGFQLEERFDAALAGSPGRSCFRTAVRASRPSATGAVTRSYVLEEIGAGAVQRRERLALLLHRLRARGLPVQTYLAALPARDQDAWHMHRVGSSWWMLTPFVEGDPLPRPVWVESGERGAAMGGFLADLAAASIDVRDQPSWDLREFVEGFVAKLTRHRPDLLRELEVPLARVRGTLYPGLPDLPKRLCHGDYHPLNVLWDGVEVRTVIDWEFAGLKPELYDAAMAVGCAGVEWPEALTGGYVTAFLRGLRDRGVGSARSWACYPTLVLATRLAWLSEWLRAGDAQMVGLEIAYLRLLTRRLPVLASAWGVESA